MPRSSSRCGNAHRIIYAIGIANTLFADGYANAYEFLDTKNKSSTIYAVIGYASATAILAALKAYCLPGKDLVCVDDDDASSSQHTPDSTEAGSPFPVGGNDDSELASHVEDQRQALEAQWYPAKYFYLAADHFTSFNALAFMLNATIQCVVDQTYETAEEAQNSAFDIPTWVVAIYMSYYLLIDAPFISAIDSKTSHEEIFSDEAHQDKATQCLKSGCWPSLLSSTKNSTRVLGSLSHTAQEVIPLVLAVNHFYRLRDIANGDYWPTLIGAGVFAVVGFATVFAQTYYYEGAEQAEAYDECVHAKNKEKGYVTFDDEPLTPFRYAVDRGLKRTLWLSPFVHAAAEALPWLLMTQFASGSEYQYTCYALSVVSFVNELVGNFRSEYPEAMEQIDKNIDTYKAANHHGASAPPRPLTA